MPEANMANMTFGILLATSKAFAAPILTPTAAMRTRFRTRPSARETKVPEAIKRLERPRDGGFFPADSVGRSPSAGVVTIFFSFGRGGYFELFQLCTIPPKLRR